MNWLYAFSGADGDLTRSERRAVRSAIHDYNSDWSCDTSDDYIEALYDSDGDDLWNCNDYEPEYLFECMSVRFIKFMNKRFGLSSFIGSETKLPLPGSSKLAIGTTP